jgi:hypothetical protein
LLGILDNQRVRSSPLEWATVLKPLGGGEHIIDENLRVGSVAPEASFIPGTRVLVAAGHGDDAQGRVIVGFSPPIQGGSKQAVRVLGTLPLGITEPTVPPVPAYYSFLVPGDGTIVPSVYDSVGAYIEDRSAPIAIADAPNTALGGVVYIATDSGGFVGDGSIAYRTGDNVTVIDPENGAGNQFAAVTAGYATGDLGFADGWFYWAEFGPSGLTHGHHHVAVEVRLRKCRTDGSSISTVSTQNFFSDGVPFAAVVEFGTWRYSSNHNVSMFRMTANTAVAGRVWDDVNPDGSNKLEITFPLDGSPGSVDAESPNSRFFGIPLGTSSLCGDVLTNALSVASGSIPSSFTPAWAGLGLFPSCMNVSATEVCAYSISLAQVYRGPIASLTTAPSSTITIANHPTFAYTPDLVFMI